jgi:hypothetical protein
MRNLRIASILSAAFLLIAASGCGSPATPAKPAAAKPTQTVQVVDAPAEGVEPAEPSESQEPSFASFSRSNFDNPTVIDNLWMPMKPGTRWVYKGSALDDEGQQIARRIEFTVTDLTKEIAGVRTVVAWILDYNDEELVEKEIAFYAQDNDGNVWYLGEHPEEYEGGEFVKASPWLTGIEEARAGIKMMAEPEVGAPPVYQGWGPAVEWSDYGLIEAVGQETCVRVDCFQDVVVNAESSLGETDAFQLKFYAPGVGEVRVDWKGDDQSHEALELIEYVQLDAKALAEVRALVLEVEQHAYEISPEVYGQTAPME